RLARLDLHRHCPHGRPRRHGGPVGPLLPRRAQRVLAPALHPAGPADLRRDPSALPRRPRVQADGRPLHRRIRAPARRGLARRPRGGGGAGTTLASGAGQPYPSGAAAGGWLRWGPAPLGGGKRPETRAPQPSPPLFARPHAWARRVSMPHALRVRRSAPLPTLRSWNLVTARRRWPARPRQAGDGAGAPRGAAGGRAAAGGPAPPAAAPRGSPGRTRRPA